MAALLNPRIFLVQVCNNYACPCLRSDCRGIVVLPCPATAACLLVDAWNVILILLAGDVEQNPGPSRTEELKVMMSAMLDSQKELKTRIDNLVTLQEKLELTVNSKISKVMAAIREHRVEIQALQGEITSFKGHLQFHQRHLDDLKDRSRRCNLVIFGFLEPDRENADVLKKDN